MLLIPITQQVTLVLVEEALSTIWRLFFGWSKQKKKRFEIKKKKKINLPKKKINSAFIALIMFWLEAIRNTKHISMEGSYNRVRIALAILMLVVVVALIPTNVICHFKCYCYTY